MVIITTRIVKVLPMRVKIYNGGEKEINLKKGDKFCQGIFLQYGLAYTTDTEYVTRNGGFGSTGR